MAASTAFNCFNKSSLRDDDDDDLSEAEVPLAEVDLTDVLLSTGKVSLNVILFSSFRGDISSKGTSEEDDLRPVLRVSDSSSLSPRLPFSFAVTFLSFLRLGC